MTEMYWITRLGVLETACEIFSALSGGLLVMSGAIATFTDKEDDHEIWNRTIKALKVPCVVFFIALIGTVFIPSKRDLMLIYCVGGTIDYVKQNPTAHQLPDKFVDAITRYVDSIEKENKDNNN